MFTVARLTFALIVVVTGVSMLLTAQFGYNSGGTVMMIGLPSVTLSAVILWYLAGRLENPAYAYSLMAFAIFFSCIDAYSNIGASFALKENELVSTSNQNEVADNLRTEISRKEKRLKEIQAERAWQPEYTATGAWEAKIKNLEGHFIFKRSKQCTDQTLKDTMAHCTKRQEALAGLALAKARQQLNEEFEQVTAELKADKAALVDHGGTAVSETATQIERLTQLLSLNLRPDDDRKDMAYLLMTALLGVVFSIAPAVLSYALALYQPPVSQRAPPANVSSTPYIPDNRPGPAPQAARDAYRASPGVHRTYRETQEVVVPGSTQPLRKDMDPEAAAAFAELDHYIGRIDQSNASLKLNGAA